MLVFIIKLQFVLLVSKPWSSPPIPEKDKDKKKKKLDVKEVFNNDDEDDSNTGVKKRKLVPLGMLLTIFPQMCINKFNFY